MKQQLKKIGFALFALSVVGAALFNSTIAHADEAKIRKVMGQSMPSLKIKSVKESSIKGLFEITVGSDIFYVSADGKYLIQGHLIDVVNRKDLTEEKLSGVRMDAINKLGEDKMIVFKADNSKYKVSIFTDIDCGYCRKLHAEIDKYIAEGITVQYLFYPRAGKGSDSYNKAISVWCSKDRNVALTDAKNGKTLEAKTCDNPIDEHMQLALDFDVRGTPMIVTDKGNVFPGYVPAERLVKELAVE